MFSYLTFVFLSTSTIWVTGQGQISFKDEKYRHTSSELNNDQIRILADLTNLTHMNEVLDNICIERVVGTPGHDKVRDYITHSMNQLGWTVEIDKFDDKTPNFGKLTFENVIAKLDPNANRFLALACHYDSKYMEGKVFVGATDSAVPCAQLINTAKVMDKLLKSAKIQNVSLMFIFFDGEEAFLQWGPRDSIYGARHLAKTWKQTPFLNNLGNDISELDRLDLLLLLDLIGAPDPKFYNYFWETDRWFQELASAESILAKLELFYNYSYGQRQQSYFKNFSVQPHIEDDHIPFLQKNVPVVHMIPSPFPNTWHTVEDNRKNIDMSTTENINKILRLFIASYLNIKV